MSPRAAFRQKKKKKKKLSAQAQGSDRGDDDARGKWRRRKRKGGHRADVSRARFSTGDAGTRRELAPAGGEEASPPAPEYGSTKRRHRHHESTRRVSAEKEKKLSAQGSDVSRGGGRGREDTVPMSAALGFPLATPVHDASWGRPSTRTHIYTVHTEFGHARTTPWA
jgi:hypothetical protein